MNKIFSKAERQKIESQFWTEEEQHPLLELCYNVPNVRFAMLEGVKAEGEDIFYHVANMMDWFYGWTKMNRIPIFKDEVEDEWASLLRDIREWKGITPNDRQLMADTIFRIVCRVYCCYAAAWRKKKPESKAAELWNKLYKTLERTLEGHCVLSDQKEIEQFEERLMGYFLNNGEYLMDWMVADYDGHLSDKIEKCIREEIPQQEDIQKEEAYEQDTTTSMRKRRKSGTTVTESFTLCCKRNGQTRVVNEIYNEMQTQKLIEDTDLLSFALVFKGEIPDKPIGWCGSARQLRYFIEKGIKSGCFKSKIKQHWCVVEKCFWPMEKVSYTSPSGEDVERWERSKDPYKKEDLSKTKSPEQNAKERVDKVLELFTLAMPT